MAGEGVPARARLRYRDPQNGKWRVFDTIEIDGGDDVGEGFNEMLAAFAVSATIHRATLQGWEAFEFQVLTPPPEPDDWEATERDHASLARPPVEAMPEPARRLSSSSRRQLRQPLSRPTAEYTRDGSKLPDLGLRSPL